MTVAGVVATGVAFGTPPIPGSPPPVSTPVFDVNTVNTVKTDVGVIKLRTTASVRVTADEVVVSPGWSSGWHSHAGAVIFAVKAGVLTMYDAHCERMTLAAGHAAIEAANAPVVVRNESAAPARFVPTQIIPVGAPLRIDFPHALCGVE
jgi:quercetin dioxygenase-like cupin family protein